MCAELQFYFHNNIVENLADRSINRIYANGL